MIEMDSKGYYYREHVDWGPQAMFGKKGGSIVTRGVLEEIHLTDNKGPVSLKLPFCSKLISFPKKNILRNKHTYNIINASYI